MASPSWRSAGSTRAGGPGLKEWSCCCRLLPLLHLLLPLLLLLLPLWLPLLLRPLLLLLLRLLLLLPPLPLLPLLRCCCFSLRLVRLSRGPSTQVAGRPVHRTHRRSPRERPGGHQGDAIFSRIYGGSMVVLKVRPRPGGHQDVRDEHDQAPPKSEPRAVVLRGGQARHGAALSVRTSRRHCQSPGIRIGPASTYGAIASFGLDIAHRYFL
jgi:hypothetical protein